MRRLRPRSSLVWAFVLAAATVVVIVGSSPDRARAALPSGAVCIPSPCPTPPPTTSPPTTPPPTVPPTTPPTTPPSTSPSTVPASPYTAAFVPCGSASGPCTEEPQQIRISYQADPPAAVELQWVSRSRPASAPTPGSTSAILMPADGVPCGTGATCWTWPAGLTASSYILNGSYQVVVCGTFANGTCGSPFPPQDIQVAAPPGPPTHAQARASGPVVAVSWQPPTAAPPDLAGYLVARDGHTVYSCSLDGLGPGASTPCPRSLTFADRPGDGRYTYTVSAVRLGADTASRDVVASPAAVAGGGAVIVPGPVTAPGGVNGPFPGTVVAAGNGGFTPAPIIGAVGVSGGTTVGLDPAPVAAPQIGTTGAPQNLSYPADNPVVAKDAPLALKVHTPAGQTDVAPVAVLALGILLLAIAAHFLYLRVELGVVQARLTGARRRRV